MQQFDAINMYKTMKNLLMLLLSVVGFQVSACGQKTVPEMDSAQFHSLIQRDSVQLVDVRTAEEYAERKIHGALNINVLESNFMTKAEKLLVKSRPIAVYCRSGKRSLNAAKRLLAAGFDVINLKGGIIGWTSAGFPVDKE